MSSPAAIAQSGLQTAGLRLQVSAHNIANMNTPGFAPQRVSEASAGPLSGVSAQVVPGDQPGVSLEQEAIEQMAARLAFKANVFALRSAQDTTGTLLNVFA
ncbi:flagellar basal body protein [Comamonas badia]|uniref:flagellar basal body protein n=1 Tax=Comamonas badia TaxID=265291 RepID=UPI000467ADAD|nr:flagellar basal body protein [Comamonas badia]